MGLCATACCSGKLKIQTVGSGFGSSYFTCMHIQYKVQKWHSILDGNCAPLFYPLKGWSCAFRSYKQCLAHDWLIKTKKWQLQSNICSTCMFFNICWFNQSVLYPNQNHSNSEYRSVQIKKYFGLKLEQKQNVVYNSITIHHKSNLWHCEWFVEKMHLLVINKYLLD